MNMNTGTAAKLIRSQMKFANDLSSVLINSMDLKKPLTDAEKLKIQLEQLQIKMDSLADSLDEKG